MTNWLEDKALFNWHISKMSSEFFRHMDENGYLVIPAKEFYDGLMEMDDDSVILAKVKTEWGTIGNALGMYMGLKHNLEARVEGCYDPKLSDKWLRVLSRKLLRPLWPQRIGKYSGVSGLAMDYFLYDEDEISPREKKINQSYQRACRRAAERRLGKKPMAYEFLLRTRRLIRLMELGAPKEILRCEQNMLYMTSTLYHFAEFAEILSEKEVEKNDYKVLKIGADKKRS